MSTVLELVGAALICAALAYVAVPLGIAAAGVTALIIGASLS